MAFHEYLTYLYFNVNFVPSFCVYLLFVVVFVFQQNFIVMPCSLNNTTIFQFSLLVYGLQALLLLSASHQFTYIEQFRQTDRPLTVEENQNVMLYIAHLCCMYYRQLVPYVPYFLLYFNTVCAILSGILQMQLHS